MEHRIDSCVVDYSRFHFISQQPLLQQSTWCFTVSHITSVLSQSTDLPSYGSYVVCRFQSRVASGKVGCVSLSLFVTLNCSSMTTSPTGHHTRQCQTSWVKSLTWGEWVHWFCLLSFYRTSALHNYAEHDTDVLVLSVCLSHAALC